MRIGKCNSDTNPKIFKDNSSSLGLGRLGRFLRKLILVHVKVGLNDDQTCTKPIKQFQKYGSVAWMWALYESHTTGLKKN